LLIEPLEHFATIASSGNANEINIPLIEGDHTLEIRSACTN